SSLLSWRPVVTIGLISYGLCLWHWPIMVFWKIIDPAAGIGSMVVAIPVALILSGLSYIYLDNPVRQRLFVRTRRAAFGFGAGAVFCTALTLGLLASPMADSFRENTAKNFRNAVYGEQKVETLATIEHERQFYMSKLNLNFNGRSGKYNAA